MQRLQCRDYRVWLLQIFNQTVQTWITKVQVAECYQGEDMVINLPFFKIMAKIVVFEHLQGRQLH